MKNKALLREAYTGGIVSFNLPFTDCIMVKDPHKFLSSDELRKMKNRNKRRK